MSKASFSFLSKCLLIGMLAVGVLLYTSTQHTSASVSSLLNDMGFTTPAQHRAFESLLQKSAIISDTMTLDQAFPPRLKTEELIADIAHLVQKTQQLFRLRTQIQERWETKPLDWMTADAPLILENMKVLGFIDAVHPAQQKVDAICILGGTGPRMADRLEYAHTLIEGGLKAKSIILLGGERYVTKNIDGTENELEALALARQVTPWEKLTETHLIQSLYQNSPLAKHQWNVYVVNTPRGNLPRPTTQTILLHLLDWLKAHPEIKSLIFVSHQPYVHYQKAIIDLILKIESRPLTYEVVGAAPSQNLSPHFLLEALGSYIWAATPPYLLSLKRKIHQQKTRDLLKESYDQNPVILQKMAPLF